MSPHEKSYRAPAANQTLRARARRRRRCHGRRRHHRGRAGAWCADASSGFANAEVFGEVSARPRV